MKNKYKLIVINFLNKYCLHICLNTIKVPTSAVHSSFQYSILFAHTQRTLHRPLFLTLHKSIKIQQYLLKFGLIGLLIRFIQLFFFCRGEKLQATISKLCTFRNKFLITCVLLYNREWEGKRNFLFYSNAMEHSVE